MLLSKWLFAQFYDVLNSVVESKVLPYRRMTAGRCEGHVLEIGAGTGANLSVLQHTSSITAVEPDRYMRRKLRSTARNHNMLVNISSCKGEGLSFPDDHFDSVFTTLVLCMVDDVEAVISEAYRVLRPGGKFYFYEHVVSKAPLGKGLQKLLNPFWRWVTTGCHLHRDIRRQLNDSQFQTVNLREFSLSLGIVIRIPNIVGYAVK